MKQLIILPLLVAVGVFSLNAQKLNNPNGQYCGTGGYTAELNLPYIFKTHVHCEATPIDDTFLRAMAQWIALTIRTDYSHLQVSGDKLQCRKCEEKNYGCRLITSRLYQKLTDKEGNTIEVDFMPVVQPYGQVDGCPRYMISFPGGRWFIDFDCEPCNDPEIYRKSVAAPAEARAISSPAHLNIFPNPAQDLVNVHLQTVQAYEDVTLRLVNLQGQVVLEQHIQEIIAGDNRILVDVARQAKGTYLLSVQSQDLVLGMKRLAVIR